MDRILVSNREELDAVSYEFSGELVICFNEKNITNITDELQKFVSAKIIIP